MPKFDKTFWEDKYKENSTGWNIGYPSTPIKTYIDQLSNKDISILIPGAGNAYEAEYLHQNGFKNVTVIDIASSPLENFKKRVPSFPVDNLIQDDFFNHKAKYDLIIEQTFFCALSPPFRNAYADKMSSLLNAGGKLVGLLFDFELTEQGPPFGGCQNEYKNLFSKHFNIKVMQPAHNSIEPRKGRGLFVIFEKI